jgi:4-oxalocrotonate tautomerase
MMTFAISQPDDGDIDELFRPTSQDYQDMPHIIVKLFSGRSEQQKSKIAEEVTKAVMASAECAEASVSVAIEDIEPDRWTEDVYNPDIAGKWDKVYKRPGYDPS